MLIVSQDKTLVVNFDRVESIGINNENEIACQFNDGGAVLGKYKTEERAKEVLQEIRTTYVEENCEFENGMYHMQRTYEMPEE